jgi:hypothetical protein
MNTRLRRGADKRQLTARSSKFPYFVVSRMSFSSAPIGPSTKGPGGQ